MQCKQPDQNAQGDSRSQEVSIKLIQMGNSLDDKLSALNISHDVRQKISNDPITLKRLETFFLQIQDFSNIISHDQPSLNLSIEKDGAGLSSLEFVLLKHGRSQQSLKITFRSSSSGGSNNSNKQPQKLANSRSSQNTINAKNVESEDSGSSSFKLSFDLYHVKNVGDSMHYLNKSQLPIISEEAKHKTQNNNNTAGNAQINQAFQEASLQSLHLTNLQSSFVHSKMTFPQEKRPSDLKLPLEEIRNLERQEPFGPRLIDSRFQGDLDSPLSSPRSQ